MPSAPASALCDAAGLGVLGPVPETARVAFIGLYSNRYPSIGETHGLSAVAGVAEGLSAELDLSVTVLDLVAFGLEGDEQIASLVEHWRPHILAFGLNYGTYSVLARLLKRIEHTLSPSALLVIGGALATYQADRILRDLRPTACVVLGEGEIAIDALLRRLRDGRSLRNVPSVAFSTQGSNIITTMRQLVPLVAQPPPARSHLMPVIDGGGQIFIEGSRGCSWASCTFCLRGLTDVKGHSSEYRTREPQWVIEELRRLRSMGVSQVTFADEDFLGADLERAAFLSQALARSADSIPTFDASFTVQSVYNSSDESESRARRQRIIEDLRRAGLQKGFLGIESCSPTQLRRYAKGHTRDESVEAANVLRRAGIRVEIGVILFDPLCTVDEIADSLLYMRAHDLASVASGISSELRLQSNTAYMRMLELHEQRVGRNLHTLSHDPDTLSHEYDFDAPLTAQLFSRIQYWNRKLHPVYYPAKSLSRYGKTGALGRYVVPIRRIVEDFRNETCDAIIEWVAHGPQADWSLIALDNNFADAGVRLSSRLYAALRAAPEPRHPVIERVVTASRTFELKGDDFDTF